MPWEKHTASNHLGQDTGSWPDIHCEPGGRQRENFNNENVILCHNTSIFCCIHNKTDHGKTVCIKEGNIVTCLTVVHPVEYDLWCSVPARHNVAGHFALRLSRQAKIQDLRQ